MTPKGLITLRRAMSHLLSRCGTHTPNRWHVWTGYYQIADPGVLNAYKVLKTLYTENSK